MVQTIKVKHTYDVKLAGKPSEAMKVLLRPNVLGVSPSAIPYIKPKLLVKEGDVVSIGSPLFCLKSDERIQFLSPGAGTIHAIQLGERRQLDAISIQLTDGEESVVSVPPCDSERLADMSQKDIVKQLLSLGQWGSFRCFPFRQIPSPDRLPPAIYVSLDDDEPFFPQSSVYLKDRVDAFRFGLSILTKLCDNVVVSAAKSNRFAHDL